MLAAGYGLGRKIKRQCTNHHHHNCCFLSSKVRVPSSDSTTTSWERGAKLIKNKDGSSNKSGKTNKYMEEIRSIHDPSLHIKTIEEELLGTMGKALGKQGDKIAMALRVMEQERTQYQKLMIEEENSNGNTMQLRDTVIRHNEYRDLAKKARWELLVHRQAVGFTVGNHKYVMDTFPIPDPLPLPDTDDGHNNELHKKKRATNNKLQISTEPVKRTFGNQLNWWETIGRWK